MCGIAGHWQPGSVDGLQPIAAAMARQLRTRGPDHHDTWADPDNGVAFGHQRLAVVDLTEAGHQPMASHCGRYVVCYNGEIYNHRQLRGEIDTLRPGTQWRGHSDTETLLAAISLWGLEGTLPKLNGMFALALWDHETSTLTLTRDRIGEKPLYYGTFGDALLFGSELKALRAHPAWTPSIDRDALTLFFRFQYVPAPYSIYRGVSKVEPGTIVRFWRDGALRHEVSRYWGIDDALASSQPSDAEGMEALLKDSVGLRLEADVPVGALLSGGYDSTLMVALAQSQSHQPVRTFSIGFEDPQFDEAPYARDVARHLQTDHTELYVTPAQALEVVPELPRVWCEPFGDSSQVPTYLVSQLARRQVTVALSGDGGDELFFGYTRYFLADKLWRNLARLPRPLRRVAGAALSPLTAATGRFERLGDMVRESDAKKFYRAFVAHWRHPEQLVVGGNAPPTVFDDARFSNVPFAEAMMALDLVTYLPDDILVKGDRASMAHSLELRIPLLDHRVIEAALKLPLAEKRRGDSGKQILRHITHQHVPPAMMDRPKKGFSVPIQDWLRGPLKDWAGDLLSHQRLCGAGYLNADCVQAKWQDHLEGRRDWHYYLWDVLMFESWRDSVEL